MKTRIIHTKIWEDDFFSSLTATQKLLFFYYVSNSRIGLSGIYEVTDRVVGFETGITLDLIEKGKAEFEKAGKIIFKNNWVYVKNSSKLGGYSGEKITKALENEISLIPDSVYEYFTEGKYTIDTLSEENDTVSAKSDTTINHKSEIINNKSIRGIVKGDFSDISSLEENHMQEIAEKYQVPLAFVVSKYDDLVNWHGKNPRKNKYANYYRGLSDWVKRDAMERRENATGKSKITYAGDTL